MRTIGAYTDKTSGLFLFILIINYPVAVAIFFLLLDLLPLSFLSPGIVGHYLEKSGLKKYIKLMDFTQ